jgi:hypothetical protein
MPVTRRSVLLGAVVAAGGLVVTGCKDDDDAPSGEGLSGADRASLAAAIESERHIVAMYEARAQDGPAFEFAHNEHVTHLAALRRLETPATPTASSVTDTDGDIEPFVLSGATQLQEAAVSAVDGALAAVLASIAASHLTPPPVVHEAEFWGREKS